MKAAYLKPFLLVAVIIVVDQIIKTWVRTHMDFNSGDPFFRQIRHAALYRK